MTIQGLNNASKGGFFVAKGESVPAGLKKYIGWDPTHNPFSEAEAPKDSVYWLATFNYYKEILEENSMFIEKLGEGQTLRDLTICETVLIHNGRGIAAFKDKLEEGKDYKYEVNATGEIVITFLKETNKTFSVALAVDASEEIFKYKNYAELHDAGDKGSVHTEGEVIKSAKDKWLTKDGLQDEENNRLVNWQVLINQDARTVNDAIVTDTIKLNQQSFILNEQDKVSVRVYEAIAKDDGFEKGQEVTKGFDTSITMNAVDGTQTMTINFEASIDSPYIIEYQTKLDPGIVNSEKITNDVKLNGSATEIHQVTKEITIKSTDGSGTSTGVNGALRIKKIDSVSKEAISKSTHFEILRKNSEGKYETFISDAEVKENKIVVDDGTLVEELSNLRYGDYAVREIDAPEGYIKDDTLYKFTISTNNQTHIFELENTKKDADPTTVKLKAKKELTGKELSAGQFSFKLLDSDKNELQTKSNDKDGQIFFDEITYDKAGTYEYTISEAIPTERETGVTYDDTKYKVTVTVEEKAGKLETTVVYENIKAGEVPTFKNTYKALPGTIQLEAKKELSGRPLKADEFSFTLKGDGGVDQTKKNAADGKVIFDEISYDQAGIYEYTISEAIPTERETGVTYDDTKYKVTVTVEEKAGKLETTVVYENIKAGEVPTFKNTYNALPGTIQLEAKKELSGRTLQADEFSFTLKGDGGVDQTKKNDKAGKVLFDAIKYDQAGTYEYTISEKIPAAKETGVTYDDTKYKVIVTVEEKAGKLEATAVYETGEVPTFKNAYKALPGSIQLEAKKELDGRSLKADEFSFNLKGDNVDQMKKNNADGKILFDQIDYDQAGTYEYTISEMIPADKETGLTYDEAVYKVTVTVVEEAGKLKAKVNYESLEAGEIPTFKNVYKALPGSIQLEAKKELDGRSLKADEFNFNLKGDNVDQTKKNAADGKVTFDEITYDQAGTYEYTISEAIPTAKETGITYDDTQYKVSVKVEENAGMLEAVATYENLEDGELPVFRNLYTPEKEVPTGELLLKKIDSKTGRTLANAEFKLVDDKGQVVTGKEKIVTGEDGSIFIKGLADGEYQIIETKAPDGYLIDETPIKFSVKNNQPSKKEINQENDPLKLPETGNSSNKTTNVKTTYRNATGKRITVSKRLPSTGSIQSKGLVILGLFFLAMFGLVVFGKRKNI
ncbi:FctA domain-containing protein [Enterococcus avium]|uniref:Spy0128 family protein n=1 Tax=Enterococcus avium TaxID=33945 RepID=UPI0032E4B120